MRSTTIVTAAGGSLLAAAVLALTMAGPSTATPDAQQAGVVSTPVTLAAGFSADSAATTPRPAPTPLTDEQMALIDEYLAAHPGRAEHLAETAARWKAFADANPELAAELAKVAALPPAERKAELTAWFADHPEQKADLKAWLKQTHDERAERRAERRERRQERRDRRGPAPSPTTSGSASTTSA